MMLPVCCTVAPAPTSATALLVIVVRLSAAGTSASPPEAEFTFQLGTAMAAPVTEVTPGKLVVPGPPFSTVLLACTDTLSAST